MSEKKETTWSI